MKGLILNSGKFGFTMLRYPYCTTVQPPFTYCNSLLPMTAKTSSDHTSATQGGLTHFDQSGQAHMVDVGSKAETHRIAVATGTIRMQPETLAIIQSGTAKKGDVLGIARVAAIMATKRTSDLIPLCHPLALTRVTVDFSIDAEQSSVTCTARGGAGGGAGGGGGARAAGRGGRRAGGGGGGAGGRGGGM